MGRRRMRACEVCAAEYRPTYSRQRTCGRLCGAELRRRIYGFAGYGPRKSLKNAACRVYFQSCDVCGALFAARSARGKRCSSECRSAANRRDAAAAIMRRYRTDPAFRLAVIAAAGVRSRKLIRYLVERDRGRCGLCHEPVRAESGLRGPSIDHIVPRSRGGDLKDLANLQLAHLDCNIRKGNRGGGEQLLLVG